MDERFSGAAATLERLRTNVETVVIGKTEEITLVLTALACRGHVLLEDVPGTAKTVLARAVAGSIEGAEASRIQCTPDLQPTDVTGLTLYDQRDREFRFRAGPVFANVLLVDEINRAMPKTQSALLEAMAEQQVTVDGVTHRLPDPFLLLATENPIEQEGTYPLPEAQLDRFLMHVVITYPDEAVEGEIIKLNRAESAQKPKVRAADPAPVPQQAIFDARAEIDGVFVSDLAQNYMVDVIYATRFPGRYGNPLSKWIQIGASPRGSLALDRCARARAWLDAHQFVTPDHIRAVMHDCLRHRLILSYEAVSQGVTADQVIDKITTLVSPA